MGALHGPVVSGQPVFSSSGTQHHPLGARFEDSYGRTYRYCGAGGTSLVVGNAIQSPVVLAGHLTMTPSAAAIGDRTISVTPSTSQNGAADLYAEGLATVVVTPGLGYSYPVKGHLAITGTTLFVLNLEPGWEIVVALTATSQISLSANPYKNVIQMPTTLTSALVGVAPFIIATTEFGWLGTGGVHGTLLAATPSAGEAVMAGGTAGALVDYADGNNVAPVGQMMQIGVSGEVNPVNWWVN